MECVNVTIVDYSFINLDNSINNNGNRKNNREYYKVCLFGGEIIASVMVVMKITAKMT